jgi:hypothetical protein
MARIAGAPARGLLRLVYFFTRRRYGRDLEPVRVVAHQRWILGAAGAYELMLERAHLVDKRLKILAGTKTASLVGCVF